MKTIAEIQQELRSIRTELQKMDSRLSALDDELLNYKDAVHEDSEYKRIYKIAQSMPVIIHPIISQNTIVKNNYFGILLVVATADDSINEDQLLFLQRIVLADENNGQLDHYLASLGTIIPENILYKIDETVGARFANQLLLDMLILAKLSKVFTKKAFEIISNLAAFFGMNKYDIEHIAAIAIILLKQQIGEIEDEEIIKGNGEFGYYLKQISGWEDLVLKAKPRRMELAFRPKMELAIHKVIANFDNPE